MSLQSLLCEPRVSLSTVSSAGERDGLPRGAKLLGIHLPQ